MGKPRVAEQWRLRNDGRNILAYRSSVLGHSFITLSPFEACVLPMLDGTATLDEIAAVLTNAFEEAGLDGLDHLREHLETALERFVCIPGLIAFAGPVSPSLRGSREGLVPDLRSYEYPVRRLACPISLQVAYTNRCAAECLYCYAQRLHVEEAQAKDWVQLMDQARQLQIFLVDIAGGDIFAREDALCLLEAMVARDFGFFVSTKSLLTAGEARRLARLHIGTTDVPPYLQRRVQVSVDSADPAVASKLTGVPGYLDRAAATVEHLLAAGIMPRVKGVLTSMNIDGVADVVGMFSKLGVQDFDFVLYTRSHYRHEDALFPDSRQKADWEKEAARIVAENSSLNITVQTVRASEEAAARICENWETRAVCSGGRSNLIIQPNGDVTLCDQVPHAPPFIVGNVFEQGILGVWNSDELTAFLYPPREKFQGSVCCDCDIFDECISGKGYCYRDALFYFGSIYDAPPECSRQTKVPLRKL